MYIVQHGLCVVICGLIASLYRGYIILEKSTAISRPLTKESNKSLFLDITVVLHNLCNIKETFKLQVMMAINIGVYSS